MILYVSLTLLFVLKSVDPSLYHLLLFHSLTVENEVIILLIYVIKLGNPVKK